MTTTLTSGLLKLRRKSMCVTSVWAQWLSDCVQSDHIAQCHMLISCQIDTSGASKITSENIMSRNSRFVKPCMLVVTLPSIALMQLGVDVVLDHLLLRNKLEPYTTLCYVFVLLCRLGIYTPDVCSLLSARPFCRCPLVPAHTTPSTAKPQQTTLLLPLAPDEPLAASDSQLPDAVSPCWGCPMTGEGTPQST